MWLFTKITRAWSRPTRLTLSNSPVSISTIVVLPADLILAKVMYASLIVRYNPGILKGVAPSHAGDVYRISEAALDSVI